MVWDTLEEQLHKINWHHVATVGMRILLILLLAWITQLALRVLLRSFQRSLLNRLYSDTADTAVTDHTGGTITNTPLLEGTKRIDTLTRLLRQGCSIAVTAITVLLLLSEMGVNMGPLLASAGIVGLAVGFGAQSLVRDVISGFFIVLENQVRLGDTAIVNGTTGTVEQINFRTTVLRDVTGTVHVFPNGTITTLANQSKDWSAYVFEIGVAYKEDTDKVIPVIENVGNTLRKDPVYGPMILEPIEVMGVDQLADSAVIIKARIKTIPSKQWDVGRQFWGKLKKAFDAEGIEIPFPHRQVYLTENDSQKKS